MMASVSLHCLQWMKSDGLLLWQKLAALGFFCEQLTKTIKNGGNAGIPELLKNFDAMVSSGAIVEALSAMLPDYGSQAVVLTP
jgi:lysine-N-methylase